MRCCYSVVSVDGVWGTYYWIGNTSCAAAARLPHVCRRIQQYNLIPHTSQLIITFV